MKVFVTLFLAVVLTSCAPKPEPVLDQATVVAKNASLRLKNSSTSRTLRVLDTGDKVEVLAPVDGKPTPLDITAEMREACDILVPNIVDGIQKLVSTFNPEFQEKLRHNVLLSGGGGLMRGLNKRIEDAMQAIGGGRVTIVEEPLYAGANGALQLALDMPGEYWQQLR